MGAVVVHQVPVAAQLQVLLAVLVVVQVEMLDQVQVVLLLQ
jgi:hypothetical protein